MLVRCVVIVQQQHKIKINLKTLYNNIALQHCFTTLLYNKYYFLYFSIFNIFIYISNIYIYNDKYRKKRYSFIS